MLMHMPMLELNEYADVSTKISEMFLTCYEGTDRSLPLK
jgi:hypothetical protein